jgi:DNA mismatch repair protein MutS
MREGKVVRDYFDLLQKYQLECGEKTTVVFQKGHFYEMYGIENRDEKINDLQHICRDILNIDVTYTAGWNETSNSRSNPQMAGFPLQALPKHLPLMLRAGYTVVEVIEDGDDPENKCKRRRVKCVHSLSTSSLLDTKGDESNYLLSLHVDNSSREILTGISIIDVRTGECDLYHFYEVTTNEVVGSCLEVIHSIRPKEILLTCSKDTETSQRELIEMFSLGSYQVHYQHNRECHRIIYQNNLLSTLFPDTQKETPLSYLGLSQYQEVAISYVYLLKFVRDHDNDIVYNLPRPRIHNKSQYLSFSKYGISHLNLLSNGNLDTGRSRYDSLYSVINMTVTNMGSRLLRERIRLPIYDVKKLTRSYRNISKLTSDRDVLESLSLQLKELADLSRLIRSLALGTLTPQQFLNLHKTLDNSKKVFGIVSPLKLRGLEVDSQKLDQFIEEYTRKLNIEKLLQAPITRRFEQLDKVFRKGVCDEIDTLKRNYKTYQQELQDVISKVEALISGTAKMVENERGFCIRTTKKRGQILESKLPSIVSHHKWSFETNKSGVDISSDRLQKLSRKMTTIKESLHSRVETLYKECLLGWYSDYQEVLTDLNRYLAELDLLHSFAKVALIYKYVRPVIQESESSFFSAVNIRNPLIERLITDTDYVPTNLEIGLDKSCLLLFGINSSGKSTALRTAGLNIVLAQIGSFVAADSFTYYPYRKLITKMTNEDNLYLGQSTFVAEMLQLKEMLLNSDQNTLLLGDEIASGTETHSAVAILAASIKRLCQLNVSTLFTTHYHELTSLHDLMELSNLTIKHIEIRVVNGELYYNRDLKDGAGRSDYGIKIASLLNMDEDFITSAKQYKKIVCSSPISNKKSRYNQDLYLSKCSLCDSRKNLDTHHIKFQKTADDYNMVGSKHKNVKSNLAVLCESCHNKLHSGKIAIQGYIETESGPRLIHTKL